MKTKEQILNAEINKAAQTKSGITYNGKIKRVALQAMQLYANQQLILHGVVSNEVQLCGSCGEKNDLKNTFCYDCGSIIKDSE